jgi:hypothetical protein
LATAYYVDGVTDFINEPPQSIVGALSVKSDFAVEPAQIGAWLAQVDLLQAALVGVDGHIFFEFVVPRIGSRIDVVLISGPIVFVLEFKVGESQIKRADINQVWDYALDLKNFHLASHHCPIIPILIATNTDICNEKLGEPHADNVYPPLRCNSNGLRRLIDIALTQIRGSRLDPVNWANSYYQPTPTIIEAAQALFANHSVDAIARHDAGARNLKITSTLVEDLVEHARSNNEKIIIFVTGVPGAGKTLVGLNVATKKRDPSQPSHAVFLSGNGPLVAVLTEALIRDEMVRLKREGDKTRKGDIAQRVKAFIQNVHHFRDSGLKDVGPPSDHVVIFDEAQRAWNKEKTADFMLRKRGRADFKQSEPEFLISYMDRHDWAAIICLVGGGQEINSGEAGISAWLEAVNTAFPSWHVYVSPNLTDSEYAAGHAIDSLRGRANVSKEDGLHLAVSMRSFRAENVATFVKEILDCEVLSARKTFAKISSRYPIVLTRDLNAAKCWVRANARGSEQYGLVASSAAQRLKPHAIDVRVAINPIHWYLSEPDDTRSSFYLEDVATEFQVQGLELDWVCMSWDADFRYSEHEWKYHSFVGMKWNNVKKPERQQYLKNAYRVLLTRARQGMVIFVPEGEQSDMTRSPAYYDSTFEYLAGIGIPILSN